jgi:hypothetical protein
MEKLIMFNFNFFRAITPGDLGGYLERRTTTETYNNGQWIIMDTAKYTEKAVCR